MESEKKLSPDLNNFLLYSIHFSLS